MKLYSMSGTCAVSVHIVLEWIGEPFTVEVMAHGDNRADAFLATHLKSCPTSTCRSSTSATACSRG